MIENKRGEEVGSVGEEEGGGCFCEGGGRGGEGHGETEGLESCEVVSDCVLCEVWGR